MTSQFDDPDLPDLVSAAMELRDEGVEPPLEVICAQRPDLLAAVRESLEASLQIGQIHENMAGEDRFVGKLLGRRYRLEQRLGSGSMGVVYRAEDQELNRRVAVKILRSSFLDTQESELRFQREAEVLASIKDERIVRVFDRGRTHNDDPFLVMELLEGATLAELLDRAKQEGATTNAEISTVMARELGIERLPSQTYIRTAARWTADIAGGLESAHRQGVFHRDVKPSNIYICKDGRAKLIDFGIAAQQEQATLTREGAALGTPAYIAPESLGSNVRPGPSLDVYGLCASLYHMLAMRPPYTGTPAQILAALEARPAKPLSRFGANVPRDLLAIVETGMARKAAGRYESAEGLEADVNAFLGYRPVKARRISPLLSSVRLAWRSNVVRALLAVGLIAGVAASTNSFHAKQVANRKIVVVENGKRIMPALTVQSASRRKLTDQESAQIQADYLDACVGASPATLPYRAYRAAFRLDQGDHTGAVEDMWAIANELGTSLSSELARRFAKLELSVSGEYSLGLEDVPEVEGGEDRFLLGYLFLREGNRGSAAELLGHPELASVSHAQAMLLHCAIPKRGFSWPDHLRGGRELERIQGYRSADSANHIGVALVNMMRYTESIPILVEGLDLAPTSTGMLSNLARARWRVGDVRGAQECYEDIIRIRPNYLKAYRLLIHCLLDFREAESARDALERTPFPTNEAGLAEYECFLGEVEIVAALRLHDEGVFDASRTAAERALQHFEKAESAGHKLPFLRPLIASALIDGGSERACRALLAKVIEEPWNDYLLKSVETWTPAEPSAAIGHLLIEALGAVADYRLANPYPLDR